MLHIIGGGLAGLSCAIKSVKGNQPCVIYEASPQAGGRCRSYQDTDMGCVIDNGNHILLGANLKTLNYLNDIGTRELVTEISPATFPFMDINNKNYWAINPASPYLPIWMLNPQKRIPNAKPFHYLETFKLAFAKENNTVEQIVSRTNPLYDTLWDPMCRAILNTSANEASACMLWKIIKNTFLKGEKACRPIIFNEGLSATLITPALNYLKDHQSEVFYKTRIKELRFKKNKVIGLSSSDTDFNVSNNDAVVLAVPPEVCANLWPKLNAEFKTLPIVNVHFRLRKPTELPGGRPFLGLIGSHSQWIFSRKDVVSVTISVANEYVDMPNWELAELLWTEVKNVCGIQETRLPPWRVIKERRATIAQTPQNIQARPQSQTVINNLFIAGDWTNTGLPATIEGSVTSGNITANLAMELIKNPN